MSIENPLKSGPEVWEVGCVRFNKFTACEFIEPNTMVLVISFLLS